jgi:8-oxo-dGTP diphosphatase
MTMNPPSPKPFVKGKRGVVGVMLRGEKLLTIRRSLHVTAPGKLCLPGGTIEFGETEEQALVREMQEELAIQVMPVQCCWRSVTPWGTKLAFWYAELEQAAVPTPDLLEVAEVHWMDRREIHQAADVLPSLPRFIEAWRDGQVTLPIRYQ